MSGESLEPQCKFLRIFLSTLFTVLHIPSENNVSLFSSSEDEENSFGRNAPGMHAVALKTLAGLRVEYVTFYGWPFFFFVCMLNCFISHLDEKKKKRGMFLPVSQLIAARREQERGKRVMDSSCALIPGSILFFLRLRLLPKILLPLW